MYKEKIEFSLSNQCQLSKSNESNKQSIEKVGLCDCNQGQTTSESESTIFTLLLPKKLSLQLTLLCVCKEFMEEIQTVQILVTRKLFSIISLSTFGTQALPRNCKDLLKAED